MLLNALYRIDLALDHRYSLGRHQNSSFSGLEDEADDEWHSGAIYLVYVRA